MERELLLFVLLVLLGGIVMQPFACWSGERTLDGSPADLERRSWLRLWRPLVPLLLVVAWLCGWALMEPDPVPDVAGRWILGIASIPFALLFGRAAARSVWALLRRPRDCGISTVGLIQPRVIFSPFLAKQLEDGVIRAALAHEDAHASNRDPLRIWIAQLVTDLQWPWPGARRRLEAWLDALELARDDEARADGADGTELAAAVLASLRYLSRLACDERALLTDTQTAHARLVGDPRALRERVSRLLAPRQKHGADGSRRTASGWRAWMPRMRGAEALLMSSILVMLILGAVFGAHLMRPLLTLTF